MKKTSKFVMLSLLCLIINLFLTPIQAQKSALQNSDFSTINQEWKGQLQYLNYGDDKSIVKIPCTLKTDFIDGKINSFIEFDEKDGNGKKMTSEAKFYLSEDGKYFMIDQEKWEIISTKKTDQIIQIIAKKRGEDKNRAADMRTTWRLEKGNSITWKKDIRYDGTKDFFNRNSFTFSKK
ncbi:MAG: hypothetical protein AB8H03_12845 [Saprospiraceae bacterium]